MNNKPLQYALIAAFTILGASKVVGQTQSGVAQSQAQPSATVPTDSNTGRIEEIIVTAQRRSESLQDVPIAVTAVTAARLDAIGVTTTQDIAEVTPGLSMPTLGGYVEPHIRGVGTSSVGPGLESPVATYIDGVYIASAPASLLTLDNIDRIEVLKGPQGTLFGRNATGGLVQIVTKDPQFQSDGTAQVTYGNYQDVVADAYYTAGLSDKLAADIAIRYEHQGEGWGRNIADGDPVGKLNHDLAVRSKFLFDMSDATRIRLSLDYQDRTTSQDVQHLTGGLPALYDNPAFGGPYGNGNFYDVDYNTDETNHLKAGGVSLHVDHDFDFATLRSIIAYRDSYFEFPLDLDYTPLPLLLLNDVTRDAQLSQEIQLSSLPHSWITWTTGLYHFYANDRNLPLTVDFGASPYSPVPFAPVNITVNDKQLTNSAAAYGQATFSLPFSTDLTLGGRYTYERKSVSGNQVFAIAGIPVSTGPVPTPGDGIPSSIDFNRFNYRAALDHQFGGNILGYISYNTGFKSGGYNIAVANNVPYQPETIKATEIGLKTELLDQRLRANIAAFHYDYQNIQVSRFVEGNEVIYNGAKARIDGADIDLEAVVTSELTLNGGVSYIDSEFQSFPNADYFVPIGGCIPGPNGICIASAQGHRLPFAPLTAFSAGADYKTRLGLGIAQFDVNYYYTAKAFAAPSNTLDIPAYGLLSASATWRNIDDRYFVKLWGKNLTDKRYATFLAESAEGSFDIAGAPRTFGMTLGVKL
jgi:iron complex outermembrane receptor protein